MKLGIIGGTFNPVHLGHLRLAEEVFRKIALDKLVFIPAYIPPHKPSRGILSFQERYRMIELAIKGKPAFEVSEIEMRRKGASYSIETVKELKKAYGEGARLYFIVGSDYAGELGTWKDIHELKRLCSFMIASRPGYEIKVPIEGAESIKIDTPDISSSDIRKRIKDGESCRELLPDAVHGYILKKKLYK